MITIKSRNAVGAIAAGLAALLLLGATTAQAGNPYPRPPQGGHDQHGGGHHGYVVPPGHRVRELPAHYNRVYTRHHDYYYYGGVFYRPNYYNYPYYNDYVVVGAPIGARVGWLPPGYISFGLGGHNYAYFNATFYLWDPPRRDYVVVERPEGAEEAMAGAPGLQSSAAELYVYPARGQSEAQTQRDRYECHLWAVDQTKFDPSMGDADAAQSGEYRRAITACLEGRGYTVR